MNMKILQVTNFYKPSWESGGPARVAYEMSHALTARGHNVVVYSTDGFKMILNVPTNRKVIVDGIEVYYFKNLSSTLAKKPCLTPYYVPVIARSELTNFDIIHIHELSVLGIIIMHYAKKFKIPYILQAHGSLPFLSSGKRNLLGRLFFSTFEKPLIDKAARLIALTKTEADQYVQIAGNSCKIKVLPNGISANAVYPNCEKNAFRKRYNISEDELLILYMGRLNKSKGLDLLFRSFSDVSKCIDNSRLLVIGPDDGYGGALNNLAKNLNLDNRVIFSGFIPDETKYLAYMDSDVFVTPCFSGFPITFLEACYCGVPIVTTKKGDELNWIHNNVGFVAEYDRDSLAKALIKILRNSEVRKNFGRNGKELINRQFNWTTICRELEDIYLDVLLDSQEEK